MVVVAHRSVRILIAIVVAAFAASACGGPASEPTHTGSPAVIPNQPAGGGGTSLVAAARKVTDVCPLMPGDLVPAIVPGASAPQSQKFPPYKCTISNGTSVLEVTIGAYDAVDPLVPNEAVAGLGSAAYLQKQQPDDAYIKIILDPAGGAVYVEVAGHDGKDHGDDAIAVAKRILAALAP